MPHATIVIPCYNEASRLDVTALRRFLNRHEDVALLMVNDGSTDQTLAILQSLAGELPGQVHVYDLPHNSGKSEAVRLGMLTALADSPGYVGFLDADLATPLEEIPRFLEVLKRRPEIDLVIGTRLKLLGRQILRNPSRRLLGSLFASVASRMLGVPIADTQCGAKVFRASPSLQSLLRVRFLSRWIFDVEIFARMILLAPVQDGSRWHCASDVAERIYELPLERWRDVAGSRLRGKDFVRASIELMAIYWHYFLASSSPLAASLAAGTLSTATEPSEPPHHRQAA